MGKHLDISIEIHVQGGCGEIFNGSFAQVEEGSGQESRLT